jgi:uncharacterized protein
MTLRLLLLVALSICGSPLHAAALPDAYVVDHRRSPHGALRPLPFDAVEWTKGFWADRFRQLADVTLDESWRLLADPQAGHVLENFHLAAGHRSGAYAGTQWQDEWLYKWIEAAACVWRTTRDPQVARRMDEAIALIAAAQQPDGYLSTNIIVPRSPRFVREGDHEVYNMGHLLTAGVIHWRMTGQDSLFRVARKTADFLSANLGVTVPAYFAHNPSAIMGLVEFYRATGDRGYLECAARIVDQRGTAPRRQGLFNPSTGGMNGTDVIQDRVPVRASREVVGHNVFFTYLYTGAADLVTETGDEKLAAALERLWTDLTQRKMFVHGGVSARPQGLSNNAPVIEAAGAPFELPNAGCYNETCGQIGCFMWGYRMLVTRPDAAFGDIMEREMYNGFLPSLGLEGKTWFYRNVLRRYDVDYRPAGAGAGPPTDMVTREAPGRKQICCPSNFIRTLAQLSAYFYSLDDAGVWVHHYGGTRVACTLASGEPFAFEQITDYPWSGEVRIRFEQAPAKSVTLRLRVPAWAGTSALAVNGHAVPAAASKNGYLVVARTWQRGDVLTLSLPLQARLVVADPRVEETRNQVAVMRGPVLYCVESPDLPAGVNVPAVHVASDAEFAPVTGLAGAKAGLAGALVVLQGPGLQRPVAADAGLYRLLSRDPLRSFPLTLVPYFAWANRGPAAMSVWLPVVLKPGSEPPSGKN